MKKIIFTLISFVIFSFASPAQTKYVFIEFKDAQKPAVQNEYAYPEKTVGNAIEDKLSKMGFKGKESKGYTMYKGVTLVDLGGQPIDLYFKVDRKSKRDKENTSVTMLISKGNENFVSDSSDAALIGNAKNFLDNLTATIAAYDLQQQIEAQDEVLKKAEKKYRSLGNEGDDLQKKKKKLEQDIEDNIKAQRDQAGEVEKQKQLLENLKSRQKKE